MMDKESENLIRAWLKLADKESPHLSDRENVYFRFMALWVAFNAYLNRKYRDRAIRRDREKVRTFANVPDNASNHKSYLTDKTYSEAVGVLRRNGVKDMMSDTNKTYNINDHNCFSEVMECVYQVRCNLFHGDKSVDGERDQSLVNASHTIVAKHLNLVLG